MNWRRKAPWSRVDIASLVETGVAALMEFDHEVFGTTRDDCDHLVYLGLRGPGFLVPKQDMFDAIKTKAAELMAAKRDAEFNRAVHHLCRIRSSGVEPTAHELMEMAAEVAG